MPKPRFPVGLWETTNWLEEIGTFFNVKDRAQAVIREQQALYAAEAERLRPQLSGKKLMIVSFNHNVDWVIEAARDTGMAVLKVGILTYTQDNVVKNPVLQTRWISAPAMPRTRGEKDITRLEPHLVLSNYCGVRPAGKPPSTTPCPCARMPG